LYGQIWSQEKYCGLAQLRNTCSLQKRPYKTFPKKVQLCTLCVAQLMHQNASPSCREDCMDKYGRSVHLSEGRGQNNQQPTPNDNKKRVVVFLCGSGIYSSQGDVLHTFRQGAGWKGRASDGEDVRLRMILTPLQPTTVVRKSPGMQQQGWCRREAWGDGSCFKMRWTVM